MNLSSATSSLLGSRASTSVSSLTISVSATLEVASATPATSVELSGPAKFLAALKTLQQAKPEEFKQVVADLAKQVRTAADASSGREEKFLERLARRLDKVAETGDLSALQRGRHGEGRRAHGVQAYQDAAAQVSEGSARAARHADHDHDGDDDGGTTSAVPPPPPPLEAPPSGPPAASSGTPAASSGTPAASATAEVKKTIAELLAELLKKVEEAVAAATTEGASTVPAAPPRRAGGLAELFQGLLTKVEAALAPAPAAAAPPSAETA